MCPSLQANFNPLAPRGARPQAFLDVIFKTKFQSTRPSRGETACCTCPSILHTISIHSPLAGRDCFILPICPAAALFQSTRPSRGETILSDIKRVQRYISIHSPLAGRDPACGLKRPRRGDFNPLAPRGARPWTIWMMHSFCRFQSTRPSRGETSTKKKLGRNFDISIHSPLAGRDGRVSMD